MVRRAVDDVLTAVGIEPDDFDLQYFTGDALPPYEILAAAGTVPFLAERRTVVVRNAGRMDLEQLEAKDFKNLPDHAFVILVADEEAGSEEKQRKTGRTKASLEKMVKDGGGFAHKFEANPAEAKEIVKSELHRLGKKISNPAIDLLLEMTGGSASRSLEETEKLVLFTRAESISEQDVKAIVVPSREWNVFRVLDSVIAGEVGEALRQLQTVITNKAKVEDVAFANIFPMFSRNLRLFWQARICVEAGCNPASPPPEVLRQFPEKPNLAKEQPYMQGKFMRTAKTMTFPQIAECMAILSDADARLKGAKASFSSLDTIEQMLINMARIFRSK